MPFWAVTLAAILCGAGAVICYRFFHSEHPAFARATAAIFTALSLLSLFYIMLTALLLNGID